MAIRVTVSTQRLFSGFVTVGRHGKWLLTDINLFHVLIRQMAALVGRALAEVCTVLMFLSVIAGSLGFHPPVVPDEDL